MNKRICITCIATMLCLIVSGCSVKDSSEQRIPVAQVSPKLTYQLSQVMEGDLSDVAQVSCTYKPAKKESLCFSVGGVSIDQVYVTQGQQVKKGTLLATLDQKSLISQREEYLKQRNSLQLEREQLLQKQELELSNHSAVIERLQAQYDAATQEEKPDLLQQLQDAKAACENAKSQYEKKITQTDDSLYILSLRLNELGSQIQKRCLYAGISGTVTYIQDIRAGQRSVQGDHFITVSDFSSAVFVVKGENAKRLTAGETVSIQCKDKTYDAAVCSGKSIGLPEEENGLLCVYLKPQIPDPALTEGQKGTIEITLASAEKAVYVVKEAIHSNADGDYVFVTDDEGLRTLRKVSVGLMNQKYAQILEGLQPGEYVILDQ